MIPAAWRIAALLTLAGPAAAQDVLIHGDGGRETGPLRSCSAEACRLGTHTVPRREIAWLGLAPEAPAEVAPPAPREAASDEVFLVDGSVHAGRLVGVSQGVVVTENGEWDRPQVRWIHLAAEVTGLLAQQLPTPTPAPSATPTPAPPAAASEPRGRPAGAVQPCPADRPLGGWVRIASDFVHTHAEPCKGAQTLLVRFALSSVPGTQAPGSQVALTWVADQVQYEIDNDGCVDLGGYDNAVCTAKSRHLAGTAPLSASNNGYVQFRPTDPTLAFQLPDEVSDAITNLPLHCVHRDGSSYDTTIFIGTYGAEIGASEPGLCDAVGDCMDFCVQPTACLGPGAPLGDCIAHAERFALIPFEGTLTKRFPGGETSGCSGPMTNTATWKVCCGCGVGPAAP